MKKRLQGIVIGIMATLLLAGGLVNAKDLSEKAQIFFRDIKLYINGAEIVPKGSDGSVVEPFIMNGATYLPVRALSEALGMDVEWDGKTSTVYIGKKDKLQPDNYLDRIQYSGYKEADEDNSLYRISGKITDHLGKDYTNGMLFYVDTWYNDEDLVDDDYSRTKIEYPLNSQYTNLSGKVVLPKSINSVGIKKDSATYGGDSVTIKFYGDGELLCNLNDVTVTMPFDFDIDVTGVNMLSIKICASGGDNIYVALTDLALYE